MKNLTESLSAIAEVAEATSVWKPVSVTMEPQTRLSSWRVFQVKANLSSRGDTIHFVGHAGYEGRVCSPVVIYDKATRRGVTQSGRIYELVGHPGYNADAEHVWNRWLSMMGNPESIEVTREYE